MEMDARVPPIGQHGAFKVPSSQLSSRGRRKATSTSAMGMEVDLCLTALAVKRPRPGLRRPDGRLRGGGVRRARLQLHRQGQAVRALRPPSSANIHRFHSSRSDLPVVTVIIDAERKRLSNASRFSLGLGLGK